MASQYYIDQQIFIPLQGFIKQKDLVLCTNILETPNKSCAEKDHFSYLAILQ